MAFKIRPPKQDAETLDVAKDAGFIHAAATFKASEQHLKPFTIKAAKFQSLLKIGT